MARGSLPSALVETVFDALPPLHFFGSALRQHVQELFLQLSAVRVGDLREAAIAGGREGDQWRGTLVPKTS